MLKNSDVNISAEEFWCRCQWEDCSQILRSILVRRLLKNSHVNISERTVEEFWCHCHLEDCRITCILLSVRRLWNNSDIAFRKKIAEEFWCYCHFVTKTLPGHISSPIWRHTHYEEWLQAGRLGGGWAWLSLPRAAGWNSPILSVTLIKGSFPLLRLGFHPL